VLGSGIAPTNHRYHTDVAAESSRFK
jgi:hypothetical protein